MAGCSKKLGGPIYKTVDEYAAGTTVHGITYIFHRDRPLIERYNLLLPASTKIFPISKVISARLMWVVVVGLAVFFALDLSISAYGNWRSNPVLTTVWTTGHPIEKIPFPSITICAQGSVNEIIGI